MTIVPFSSDEEVIALANDCPFGLGSNVFSANQARARSIAYRLEAGMSSINDFATTYMCQALPFGGVKESGFGRFAGMHRGPCTSQRLFVKAHCSFGSTAMMLALASGYCTFGRARNLKFRTCKSKRQLETVFNHSAGIEGLRALCVPKSVAEDRFPWLMRSTIPPTWQYPVQANGFQFGEALVTMFYGPSLVHKVRGLVALITTLVAPGTAGKRKQS